jgi:hypothetical protein
MTPQLQTETEDGAGNCFSACLASILGVPLASVPNFLRQQTAGEVPCMIDAADQWLRTNHGKRLITIELYDAANGPEKGAPLTSQCVLNRLAHANAGEYVILSGESPRKRADGGRKYHSVVGRARVWGFEVIHDPHPDGGGIVGQPYGIRWIVPA